MSLSRPVGSLPLLLSLLTVCAGIAAAEPRVRDFEDGDASRDEWRLGGDLRPELIAVDPAHGNSLAVPVAFPNPTRIWRGSREQPKRLVAFDPSRDTPAVVLQQLQYAVHVPAEAVAGGARLQARLVVKNKDGLWFEALGERRTEEGEWVRAEALYPGWNVLRVDLSDDSVQMRPRGHLLRWSRFFLGQVVAVGFSFSSDRAFTGQLAVDNITTWTATDDRLPPFRIIDFQPGGESVGQYERFEAAFRLNRPILNPFRTKEITADVVFSMPEQPSFEAVRVPAFYYQPYRRTIGRDEADVSHPDAYVPVGPGEFRARFTPREAGRYEYYVEATYRSPVSGAEETVRAPAQTLQVLPRKDRGFVRVSETDRRYFEFEDGSLFFPLGHSFRSPSDYRHYEKILQPHFPDHPVPADRGLRAYEEMLPRMRQAGLNSFEVWMASWWLGIEWTGRWRNYHGLGVYNMEHAWKLDALLDLCRENGQYIHLVIDNHGKAAQSMVDREGRERGQVDHEWEFSPYNRENADDGGFLRYSKDLFGDPRAREHYRDKMRYIAARWGWSPNIFGIELWSELDLIGHLHGRHRQIYASPVIHDWHREMAGWLRQHDQGRHPITTHYSGDWQYIDRTMIGFPFIDYIVCDAYHSEKQALLDMLAQTQQVCLPYNKPFVVTEFGGDWSASRLEGLDGDLNAGLWWSWMSQSAGTPFFWWFEYIALVDHYRTFKAFADYIQGEDKRRGPDQPQLKPDRPVTVLQDDKPCGDLQALALGDGEVQYAWLADRKQIRHLPRDEKERRRYENVTLLLQDMTPGAWDVETWDCWSGKIVDRFSAKAGEDRILRVPLPAFVVQAAIKTRRSDNASPAPTDAPAPASIPPAEK